MRNGFWLSIYIIKKRSCTDEVITELINTVRLHRECGWHTSLAQSRISFFRVKDPPPCYDWQRTKTVGKKTILYFQPKVREYGRDYHLSTVLPTTRCLYNGWIRDGTPSTPLIMYILGQSDIHVVTNQCESWKTLL